MMGIAPLEMWILDAALLAWGATLVSLHVWRSRSDRRASTAQQSRFESAARQELLRYGLSSRDVKSGRAPDELGLLQPPADKTARRRRWI